MNEKNLAEPFFSVDEAAEGDADPAQPPTARPPLSSERFEIVVADEQSALAIDADRLIATVQAVLADSHFATATVSIAVVDDPTIHALNREFLEHDYPTDVLSFVLEDSPAALDAELVVSTDTALREASEALWPPEHELLLYVLHGALHLVGFRDHEPAERTAMLAAEVDYLSRLGVSLPAGQTRWLEIAARASEEPLS